MEVAATVKLFVTAFVLAVTSVNVAAPPVLAAPVIDNLVVPFVSRFNPKASFVPIVTAAPVVLPPFVMSPLPAEGVKYSSAVAPAFTLSCWFAVPSAVKPVPPCATVTGALLVRIVAEAFGRVKVLTDVVGPVNAVNPFPRMNVVRSDSGRLKIVFVPSTVIKSVLENAGCANSATDQSSNDSNSVVFFIICRMIH